MSDLEPNVRVNFKLSREAAIRLREIALTKSELLCNLGVLAVQLGNESQICISSSLNFDKTVHDKNTARKAKTSAGRAKDRRAEKAIELKDARKIPKVDNGVKKLSYVDRGVRSVGQAVARATAASVIVSDSLPSMNTLNKAPLMNKTSTQDSSRPAQKIHVKPSQDTDDSTRSLACASLVKGDSNIKLPMKPFPYNGVIKFNAKDMARLPEDVEPYRNSLYAKPPSKNPSEGVEFTRSEIQDTIPVNSVNMDSVSCNAIKAYAKDTTPCQEASEIGKTHASPSDQDLPKLSNELEFDRQDERPDMDCSTSTVIKLNENDMTDSFDCNVNSDINGNIPTFPGHGISFAQHLINLSKQYRLENNEKSPTGLSNEKFFASEASRIVRNDHVLRSFTTGNEKQEDFMGFSGQNALLFDGNYSATAVKSAEELSKEQSEASPTNLDSMSETSADSLFEDARLGSVDEFSLSPSSNENVHLSSEDTSRTTSPTGNTRSDNYHSKLKQRKHKRKIKYQRHLKGHSGIVCKLCMHPVQKSYSCYKLAHAPKEIKHLFNDGSHCVRVCRRCLPYKSPKRTEKTTQKKLHKAIEQLFK